jgi:hypothetical protein
MINRQLELGLGSVRAGTVAARSRRARAAWWFGQMREVVNRAFDWQPVPEPRAEQIWLEGPASDSLSSKTPLAA